MKQTEADRKEAEVMKEHDYWMALGKALGWTLIGWSGFSSSSFRRAPKNYPRGDEGKLLQVADHLAGGGDYAEVSGWQRDSIMAALEAAAK